MPAPARADTSKVTEFKRPEGWAQVIPLALLQAGRLGREADRHAADARAEAERLREVRPESPSIAAYLRHADS